MNQQLLSLLVLTFSFWSFSHAETYRALCIDSSETDSVLYHHQNSYSDEFKRVNEIIRGGQKKSQEHSLAFTKNLQVLQIECIFEGQPQNENPCKELMAEWAELQTIEIKVHALTPDSTLANLTSREDIAKIRKTGLAFEFANFYCLNNQNTNAISGSVTFRFGSKSLISFELENWFHERVTSSSNYRDMKYSQIKYRDQVPYIETYEEAVKYNTAYTGSGRYSSWYDPSTLKSYSITPNIAKGPAYYTFQYSILNHTYASNVNRKKVTIKTDLVVLDH